MSVTKQTFENNREQLEHIVQTSFQLESSKLDEAAKLLLLNAQYAASLAAFEEEAPQMAEAKAADFMIEFEKQVNDFGALLEEFFNSIKR